MALNFFGEFNAFVPEATGQAIMFARDSKNFLINDYAQLIETKKTVGLYYRIGVDAFVRNVNDKENIWKGGTRRDIGDYNGVKFDTVEFQTERRYERFVLDWKLIEQADIKVLDVESLAARNRIMTARTQRAITLLETTGGWGNNTATANDLNGGRGFWDTASADDGSGNYLAIKRTLDTVGSRINLYTNGAVNFRNKGVLRLLISPNAALKISQSPEIHSYLKESPFAMAQVKGREPGQNAQYGLPDQLYGWDILVEDASTVTERDSSSAAIGSEASVTGASPGRRYIKSDNSAVVLSRVGGLDGMASSSNFSTLQLYWYGKELEMETFDDAENRLTRGYVTEEIQEVLAAPASGWLITNILSPGQN